MDEGVLGAAIGASKSMSAINRALDSPAMRIAKSQEKLYKALNPLSEITKIYEPLTAKMDWMSALVQPVDMMSPLAAISSSMSGGVFDQLKSLENISAISRAVNRNQALYGSFLDSVTKTSSVLSTFNTLNMQAGNLAVLSMVKPNGFANVANVHTSDLLFGNVFKNLLDIGGEDEIEEFESITNALDLDDEFQKDFAKLVFESTQSVERQVDVLSERVSELSELLASKIAERKNLKRDSVMAFLSLMLTLYSIFAQKDGCSHCEAPRTVKSVPANAGNGSAKALIILEHALNDVHLRKFPRKDSKSLHTILTGQKVRVIEKRNVWMKVSFVLSDKEEVKGWVNIDMFSSNVN